MARGTSPMLEAAPATGDRILVLRENWLAEILSGNKTMEIRGRRMKEGYVWLGCRRIIYGRAYLGPPTQIQTKAKWRSLRSQHCVHGPRLPYSKTFGFPLSDVVQLHPTARYIHPKGAIGIVRYKHPELLQ